MKAQELIKMKDEILTYQRKLDELKGERKSIMARLQKDFGCSTIAEAEDKLEKMEKEKEELLEKQQELVNEIQEMYDRFKEMA